ncbi:unnamed protein product, partial [Prorocentrum cordatum]
MGIGDAPLPARCADASPERSPSQAQKRGLAMTKAGWVELDDLLGKLPGIAGTPARRADVQRVVADSRHRDGAPRFQLRADPRGVVHIRAVRNHSIPGVVVDPGGRRGPPLHLGRSPPAALDAPVRAAPPPPP